MKNNKIAFCIVFLLAVFAGVGTGYMPVYAQGESLSLTAPFPRIESALPGEGFKFTVDLKYTGDQPRTFNLNAVGPQGWTTYITSWDESIKISAITLDPAKPYLDEVKAVAIPPSSPAPKPGEYGLSFAASSGNITSNIMLTSVIKPTYSLVINAPTPGYNNQITAARTNSMPVTLKNTGTGELSNIRLSAENPPGWAIDFNPAVISSLAPGSSIDVEVNIKPPASSARNYFQVVFNARANEAQAMTSIGIGVSGPSGTWAWVGGVIGFLVVAGFVIIFIRSNRGK
jgi:uncharacterized membrane protein